MNQLAPLALIALLLLAQTVSSAPTEADKPNIVYVVADDLGYGDLGCYGQTKFRTPNVDRMAAEGMRFTDHYAGSCVCAPSRCCLMTGLHTGHARIRANADVPLAADDVTLAEVLKRGGYATGIFGKWGLGRPDTTGFPSEQGFDEFLGYADQSKAHFYYPESLDTHDGTRPIAENRGGAREIYSHDLLADAALDFVRRHQSEAFFLYVPFTIPHAEVLVPEDSLAEYRGRWEEKPWNGGHYAVQSEPRCPGGDDHPHGPRPRPAGRPARRTRPGRTDSGGFHE